VSGEPPKSRPGMSQGPPSSVVIDGIAGSPGLAIAPAVIVDTRRPGVPHRHIHRAAAEEEVERFAEAVKLASQGIRDVAARVRSAATRAEASILEAYILMIEDESLRDETERHIRVDRQCAEWALDTAVRSMVDQLQSAGDPYLAERSHDVEFVGDRILRALMNRQVPMPLMPAVGEAAIIVAHDLSPAETAGLSKDRVRGIVTEIGTRTSHTAILARALDIPAVVGAKRITTLVGSGEQLVVDGLRGQVIIQPTRGMIDAALARARRHEAVTLGLRAAVAGPAATRCGERVDLRANIELPQETGMALEHGAQGVGLYRTEFLYMSRQDPPSEDEQYEVYRRVLEGASGLPCTLRTFDIGGDKFVSAFQAPDEMNPALGLRAVRLGLARPELLLSQLRAMVRASSHGDLRVMVPMISAVRELRAVRELLDLACREVDFEGHPRAKHVPLGMMVEVPAAAILADEFASDAEFFSIGTNDLVQYALAVDRTNQELAYLASPYHPAILRLIRMVVDAGRRHDRPVSVCGAMASDPLAATLLIGMGLRELSMEASSVPEVRAAIGRISCREATEVAERAFECVTAKEVEQTVKAAFMPHLRDILEPEDG
jgi:phosphotransferase system enzyme I (PtsI)